MTIAPISVATTGTTRRHPLFEVRRAYGRTPQRTVRESRRFKQGPRWWRFNGNACLYTRSPSFVVSCKAGE